MKNLGYEIDKASVLINEISSLPIEQKLDWQNSQRWSVAKYHYNNNNFYHSKIKGHFPDKWEQLPIMHKKDYQTDIIKLLSKRYNLNNTYIANTSGSSGHPFFFAKNKNAHAMGWAIAENRYRWYDLNLDSKQARYFGTPLETTGRLHELLKDWIMKRHRFLIFDSSDNSFQKQISIYQRRKFEYIYGYTNSLVLFARYLIENNIILKNICPTLKICITTSEALTVEDRNIIQLGFGINVVNEYGVSEAGGITAFEDIDKYWRLSLETQFIEIVDDVGNTVNNGVEGKILITDLHNKAMPFIRYEVGDIGILNDAKNNGILSLSKLTGRTNDTIILPSGKRSPGLTFYYISRSILESFGIIKEFIIRQEKIDTFIFEIVSSRNLSDGEIQQIQQKMDIYLEPDLKIKIIRQNTIERPKSGKLKHFYSEIYD